MLLFLIVTFSLIGSVGAAAGAVLLLAFPLAIQDALVPALISYSAGVLLGAAFLGMIPTALLHVDAQLILPTVLCGLVLFFILEKLVLWRHCHDSDCPAHIGGTGALILIGDAFHNFVDGVVIAAAFLVSVPLGIATAVAVIAHEVPQEVGDFAILLDSGYSRAKAFWLNLLSASTTLPGALDGYSLHPGAVRSELYLHRIGRPRPAAASSNNAVALDFPIGASAGWHRHYRLYASPPLTGSTP